MTELADRHCHARERGAHPMSVTEAMELLPKVPKWRVASGAPARLERSWDFPDYKSALAFLNRIAVVAEAENHHPEARLIWGNLVLTITTYEAGALTENDFILAAKIDRLVDAG